QRAKVLDFGIAKLSRDEGAMNMTRVGTMMGTPQYMSPEQCRGSGDIDHRSDIYSLGCVIFAMLAGRPPFEGNGTGELIVAHLQEPAPLLASRVANVPPVIDEILQRCLAKEPGDRFASMSELADALLAVEEQLSVRLTPLPYVRPPTPSPVAPGAITQATAHGALRSTPTTLTAASGVHAASTPQRRWGVVGGVALAVTAGAVALVLATHGGSDPAEPAAAPGRDAVIEMTTTTPAPPIDAGVVPDATAVVVAPIDAAPAPVLPPHVHPGTQTHGHTHSPPPPSIHSVDRGD
ncbi:MAG: protein kinase, partial [Kofleriaceae bacterium]